MKSQVQKINADSSTEIKRPLVVDVGRAPGKRFMSFTKNRVIFGIGLSIIGVVVIIATISTLINRSHSQVVIPPYDNSEYINSTKEAADRIAKIDSEKAAQPINKSASNEEKVAYYSNALWVRLREGDPQKTAEYYVKTVKPENISLSTDLTEALVLALVQSSYKKEAKQLIPIVIDAYKKAPAVDNEYMKKYMQDNIIMYTKLEQSL